MGVIKLGGSSRSAELHSISITANRFISRRFSKGFGLAGVRMEFRVYAAFGYVTKVVSNGRVNAKLHFTPRNWLRLCRAVLYRRFSIGCVFKFAMTADCKSALRRSAAKPQPIRTNGTEIRF